jgi:hypothetical protein
VREKRWGLGGGARARGGEGEGGEKGKGKAIIRLLILDVLVLATCRLTVLCLTPIWTNYRRGFMYIDLYDIS